MDQNRLSPKTELALQLKALASDAKYFAWRLLNQELGEESIQTNHAKLKHHMQQIGYLKRQTFRKNGNDNPKKRTQKK